MSKKSILRFEFLLPLFVISLIVISVFFIYSANINSSGVLISKEHIKQIVWGFISVVIMIIISFFDLEKIKPFALYFFIISIGLVGLTFLTNPINGARSWLQFGPISLQPSEFCKVATIFFLAVFIEKQEDLSSIKSFLYTVLLILPPTLLILIQPDLGSACVFLSIFMFIIFLSGIKIRYAFYSFATFILTILLTSIPFIDEKINNKKTFIYDITTNKNIYYFILIVLSIVFLISLISYLVFKQPYFYWISYVCLILISSFVVSFVLRKILKEYQIMRLVIFVNPYYDPLNFGWNIIQSLTAVGSGGLYGKGFLNGTQSHYQFLPKQSSDFIFSVISEELGFFGSISIVIIYLLILLRLLYIAYNSSTKFGSVFIAGFCGMIFFHFFINIGMTISITPITGIPLLFVSYGGSSLLSSCIAMGICMNINYSRD